MNHVLFVTLIIFFFFLTFLCSWVIFMFTLFVSSMLTFICLLLHVLHLVLGYTLFTFFN